MLEMMTKSPEIATLLRSAIVWDNHACMPLRAEASTLPQLDRLLAAGVSVVSLNVGFGDMPLIEHLRVLSFMRQWIAKRPDRYSLVSSTEDVRRCKSEGKLGIVFDVEGMYPVQDEPSFVQTFYELGVRWMLIAYNRNNAAGGGCLDIDSGLTDVGRGIIDEMERVGMVLCLSHAGGRTAAEALEYSRNPAIFSHSNPYGVTPHARNVSDELLCACARKGGVVGLTGWGPFLAANDGNVIERLLLQLRYVIDLIGAEHVGLGLDFVFDVSEVDAALYPPSLDTSGGYTMIGPEAVARIAEGLARINLSDAKIRGILGENWLRVSDGVWR